MNKKLLFTGLVCLFIFTGMVRAQEPGIAWTKMYKPTGFAGTDAMTTAFDGHQLSDGGYIVVGATVNPWNKGYLVRTNSLGDTLWTKQYWDNFTDHGAFFFTDIEIASDGNFFISGYGTYQNVSGICAIKMTNGGNIIWNKFFTKNSVDTAFITYDMKVTPDGGMIITGQEKDGIIELPDAFMLKYSADGTFQWYQKYGIPEAVEIGFSVENAWDGGYLLCTEYDSATPSRVKVFKTDEDGNYQWSVEYPDQPSGINDWPCITRTSDNKYVISAESDGDYSLLKINQQGGVEWFHSYHIEESEETPFWVQQTNDGGFIITGKHTPVGSTDELIMVVKTNSAGDAVEWQKIIDFHVYDLAYRIRNTVDNGYILFGASRLTADSTDWLFMIKLGAQGGIDERSGRPVVLDQNTPNPVRDVTSITYTLAEKCRVLLQIFDVTGNEIALVRDETLPAGKYSSRFDASNLSPGIYYFRLSTEESTVTQKMVVTR